MDVECGFFAARRRRHRQPFNSILLKTHTFSILAVSIAALISPINPSARPVAAYGEIVPADVQDFGARDMNRLQGVVVRALTLASPYVDVLEGGTMPASMSDQQRVVIQERAVLNQSLVRPTFTADRDMCGQSGVAAEVGSTEYSYQIETNRGKGPLVCIKGMWSAFKTSYSAAEDALKKQLVQLNNADVRIHLAERSGCKLVCQAGVTFSTMFDGDSQRIDTPFPNVGVPTARPTIKLLQYLARFLREDLLVEPWAGKSASEAVLKFMGEQELIDILRDEAGVRDDHRYLAAGSYDIGKITLTRYQWEGPYRGIAYGIDPQPLRFNLLNAQAQPIYLEPEVTVETDNGVGSRVNPAWVRAKFAVGILMGRNSFTKLTPETYTGEGTFRFPAQSVTGMLKWENIKDNDNNVWQDFGRHYYQFTRAYAPKRPHAVCTISYAREQVDFGMTTITGFGNWSSTASL